MVSVDMRKYNYFTYGEADAYGQPQLSAVQGQVKMAIYNTSQYVQDNVQYKGATYMGLTHDVIDNSYVIQYGEVKLKVIYVMCKGRMKQVFMVEV